MRRILTMLTVVVAALLGPSAGNAAPGPDPNASCAGIITAFEARLAPGAVGQEARQLAHELNGLGSLVREVAQIHGGSVEACLEAEE